MLARATLSGAAIWILAHAIAHGQTAVSGDVSGTWDTAGSPYLLVADARVPPGESLLVEPGVAVIGHGSYRITVKQGASLLAGGTEAMPILFTAADASIGWRGILFEGANDDSSLNHCVFEHAVGTGPPPGVRGGAVMVRHCSPLVSNNEFRFNSSTNGKQNGAGGGIAIEDSNALILDNLFHDNVADSGGAIHVGQECERPTVRGNWIADNHALYAGGGMYLAPNSRPLVQRNVVLRNRSDGWGGGICSWTAYVDHLTNPTIQNNWIAYNESATDGGGLYLRYDRAIVTNNLIVANEAARGGGIFVLNLAFAVPQVGNSVVWGNAAPIAPQIGLEASTGSLVSVSWCDVEGGWPGLGNHAVDPSFVDPDGPDGILGTDDDDYRLGAGSPCIDAGNNNLLVPTALDDLGGLMRKMDDPATPDTGTGIPPIVDMGPYEFPHPTLQGPSPGQAGTRNLWRFGGFDPGERAHLAYGLQPGSTSIPGCPGLSASLSNPVRFASVATDSLGNATVDAHVPSAASGGTVWFQALAASSCRVTNLLAHTFL